MAFKSLGLTSEQIESNSFYQDIASIYDRVKDEDSSYNLKWGIDCVAVGGATGAFCVGKDNNYYNNSLVIGKGNTGSTGCTVLGMGCDALGATGSILIGNSCVHVPSGATGAGSPYMCFGGDLEPAAQWNSAIDFTATNNAVARQIPIVYNGVKYFLAAKVAQS
jgi:hypothetical protein